VEAVEQIDADSLRDIYREKVSGWLKELAEA
jgi:hypothetical protein